ncbi:hypothetical protein [uncultured Bacteroides sp.]|uniref:hypothetical protein n=1 Tax=uncultured Bacteroides sp. TaxID=162156 RepID=UPI002615BA33|nr:hypothetical protein [uncultured Bacteroides sp.]
MRQKNPSRGAKMLSIGIDENMKRSELRDKPLHVLLIKKKLSGTLCRFVINVNENDYFCTDKIEN